jgi:APA family basic amino acid/polyamine antiporter
MFPLAGGAYVFTSKAFGRLAGWLVGWLLVLEYLLAAALVSQAAASYLADLAGPEAASSELLVRFVLPVMLLIGAAALAIRGVDFSARAVAILTAIKVGVILVVIVFGARYVDVDNWRPFIPENKGTWGEFGWSGVLRGAGIVFYTYLGFDTVAVAAQEARRPQRDIPFALIGSLTICTLLFIPMVLVMTGMVDFRALNVANPIGVAIAAAGPELHWLGRLVSIGATIGMISVLIVILMAQGRILYSMAQGGLLPASLARLHPKEATPRNATILTAVLAAILSLFFPVATLGHMVSAGVLIAFVAVSLALLVLRRRHPEAERPFRTPWVPIVPIGAIGVCSYMAVALPEATWWRVGIWLLLGLTIYGLYGARSSTKAPG